MDNYWWCALFFRIFLPLVIAVAVFIRPTVTSYIYLVVGCYMPFFSVPTRQTLNSSTGNYMKILMITCICTTSLVVSFYFAIFFTNQDDYQLKPCSTIEKALRTVGIISLHDLAIVDAVPWTISEPLMLVTSVALFITFRKLCQDTVVTRAAAEINDDAIMKEINRRKILAMMLTTGKYLTTFMLCITAILKPSLLGGIYYFVFLMLLTYWACNQVLGRVFGRILVCLIPIIFLNMTIVFWYQFQYFQDSKTIDSRSKWGRLLNLVDIKTYKDCINPRIFKFHAQTNATYAVPICLFFLYYITVLVSRETLLAKDGVTNLIVALFWSNRKLEVKAKFGRAMVKIQQKRMDDMSTGADSTRADKFRMIIEQILQFIISISYLVSNFVMMIWAIVYVGWNSLILLIWANLIWILPFKKKIMLASSPFIVFWVWFLLVCSYLFSLDLSEEELPTRWKFIYFNAGADHKSDLNWINLLTKSLFGVIIFITMRQFWLERSLKKHKKVLADAVGVSKESVKDLQGEQAKSKLLENFKSAALKFFAIWWIWVVIFTMISMDFWATNNIFRIVFVALALIFVATFQLCPFKPWKKFVRFYWWIVIIYAMVNLFFIYMYQIEFTRDILLIFIPRETIERFGFQLVTNRKEKTLFLSNPIFFQIAIVVQQNILQDTFDRLTSPTPAEELRRQEKELAESGPQWRKTKTFFINTKNIIFQILEVHMQNIVLLIGWYMCIYDVCAIFVPFVLLFTASCIFRSYLRKLVIYFISVVVQIFIVLKLLYMNQYWHHSDWNYVGHYTRNGQHYNVTLNFADWLGFHESRLGRHQADFWQLSWCFLYVFSVTVMRLVEIRMKNYRLPRNLDVTQHRVLFPEITYENCHQNVGTMLKFLMNYGFYKFGSEITMIFAYILVSLRMDAVAVSMSVWLLIVFALRRTWLRIVWLPSLILIVIAVPAQYILTLGFWPSYWNYSLTEYWNSNDFLLRIQQFCHLMNMAYPPNKAKITFDFWLLLLMSRQWRVFLRERKLRGKYRPAGSNDNVSKLIDDPNVENPVPDFVTYTRTYLDVFKRLFLMSWFYLALIFTFLAGTMRHTVYSFGYIMAAFIFMWEGTYLYLRPPKKILLRWNLLICYSIVILMARLVSQIFGCILKYKIDDPMFCKIYQILSVNCVDKFNTTEGLPNVTLDDNCLLENEENLGLAYDCICFIFLIVQQRIFKSFHFFHIVNEKKAQIILEDRGALIIEERRQKKKQAMDAEDAQIRENIKKKMDRIRATHLRIQGEVYTRRKKNHRHILKSCDYYLFDEAGLANDIPLLPKKQEQQENVFDPYDPMPITEYFGLLHSSNMATVLAERDLRRTQKKALQEGRKPEGSKKALAVKESRPGTSKDPDVAPPAQKARKIPIILTFLWGAFESFIVSLTGLINRRTLVFRSILDRMTRDRKTLKEKTKYGEGVRLGAHKIWHPVASYKNVLDAAEKKTEQQAIQYSIYVKLLKSVWYLLLNHSEWLCYLLVVVNQVIGANFISMPLVLIVFCWGALTVPNPTKTFWIISIAYILIMMFLKNFFLMKSIPWNAYELKEVKNVFFPPFVIFGTPHILSNSFNLLILAAFFFNRFVLQMLGLWKPLNYRTASGLPDGDYIIKDDKFVPITKDAAKTPQALTAKSTRITMGDYFPTSLVHGAGKYAEAFKLFMQQLVSPVSAQIPVDVYTPMFLCDLINLNLIVFFYGVFWTEADGMGFIQFIKNNRVPFSYIIVVLFYFFLMVIDRGFYLRKNRFGKLIYHFFLVIGVHIWFFVLYPLLTEKTPYESTVVQVFYVSKCLYFMFSAYQIRNGYPPLISCHYLWHGTTIFNRFGYKLYRQIPYFFEMRTLLDWICSDSSLGVSDWFKMEEITQNIFDQKCEQEFEEHWCEQANKRKNRTKKYFFGGFLYFLLILTVIFPFLLFSLGGTVGVKTHPSKFKIQLYMGSAEPVFQSYASERNLITLSEEDYKNLTRTFNNIQESELIFGYFKPEDVVVVTWSPHSLTKWKVSPGTFNEVMHDLVSNKPFSFRLEILYTHVGHGGNKQQRTFGQSTNVPPLPNKQRESLIEMLKANETLKLETWVPLVFPKFLMITKDSIPKSLLIMGETSSIRYEEYAEIVNEAIDDDRDIKADPRILRNLLANLRYDKNGEMWWHVREDCSPEDDNYFYYLKDLVHNECNYLVMYTFNERVFSNIMHYFTQSGIFGLYVLYFMMIIGFVRSCRIEIGEIWIEDLPNSDRMMRKCMEVYVARDMQNYELEEELFAELIFIMRSREVLIKLTRYEDSRYNPPIQVVGKKTTK